MHNRFLSGWQALVCAAAVASFVLAPFSAVPAETPTTAVGGQDSLQQADGNDERPTGSPERIRFARTNYVWPYATGPTYGTVDPAQRLAPGVLHTSVGSFRLADIDAGLVQIPEALKARNQLASLGAQHFIVQLDPNVDDQALTRARELIEGAGGVVVEGMHVSALLARLTPAAMDAVQTLNGLIDVEPFHPAFKLDPSIGRVPLLNPAKAVSESYDLQLMLFPGADSRVVADQLAALGGTVTRDFGDTVYVEIHRSRLAEVAAIDAVRKVLENLPAVPMGEETTTTMQTGQYNNGAVPYHSANVNGGGDGQVGTCTVGGASCTDNSECNGAQNVCDGAPQVLMIIDSGIQLDANDLSDTATDAGTPGIGHRKVRTYESCLMFGGLGDQLGCDELAQGGNTHGHTVSSGALGNATNVPGGYGTGVVLLDLQGNEWEVDGVAPRALLAAYDAQDVPPPGESCGDPQFDTIVPGDLFNAAQPPDGTCPGGTCPGALGWTYYRDGARIINFSWGGTANIYESFTADIDDFLKTYPDALVFTSAGNAGNDTDNNQIPDPNTLGFPAGLKNGLAIGASRNANTVNSPESRAFFSSVGPAPTSVAINPDGRIAPQLMAPGDEPGGGALGIPSEFNCRTNDNDQMNPVICDKDQAREGTSFASPAAAGAALLVRDYFARGHYPDGTDANMANAADRFPNISGPLTKAILLASADFMTGVNLFAPYRGNNEQGWGRIQLDNALPLANWPSSPTGLIVADGAITGGPNNLGLGGAVDPRAGGTPGNDDNFGDVGSFELCNDTEELRVALAWYDDFDGDGDLVNDLNVTIESPTGKIYHGNYFTDDDNRDGFINTNTEDCPDVQGALGQREVGQWSLPACIRGDLTESPKDHDNPQEVIMLSPDYDGDGYDPDDPDTTDPNVADDNQVELGTWQIYVWSDSAGASASASQPYAVAVAGGVCLGSSVRFNQPLYVCNDTADLTVTEVDEGTDPAAMLNAGEISDRTRIEVYEPGNPTPVDIESGLTFQNTAGAQYQSKGLVLSGSTGRDPGNGVLDVRDGDQIRMVYEDKTSGIPDANKVRTNTAGVDCKVNISVGAITFGQFAQDEKFLVVGGCERNERGLFEFGFPDKYLDADEEISFNFAFGSQESQDLRNVEASLRCVLADDALAPEDCLPGSDSCLNPDREISGPNAMAPCPAGYMDITNSPLIVGRLPAGAAISTNFIIRMGADLDIPDLVEIELVLELTADTSGKSGKAVAISRHTLDADEKSVFYHTDWPTGGTQFEDWNNNELIETPTTNLGDFLIDYRFESRTFGDLTASDALNPADQRNQTIGAPWHFDTNNGGFRTGLGAVTDSTTIADTIAQWGEDRNFNGIYDGVCSLGNCFLPPFSSCTSNAQCAGVGNFCSFVAQGFCSITTATQCEVNADCPIGESCDLVDCQNQTACVVAGLSGTRCASVLEDRDPQNFALDQAWGTAGGCGWQTKAPGTCSNQATRGCYTDADCVSPGTCTGPAQTRGGIWHTGRIKDTTPNPITQCMFTGNNPGHCQFIETVSGDQGLLTWYELLVTPEVQRVGNYCKSDNTCAVDGAACASTADCAAARIEITNWGWNQAIDLGDTNAAWTWEFDTDTSALVPADLFSDLAITNAGSGAYGSVANSGNPDLTNGFSVFAPIVGTATTNGTQGNNRNADNSCYFENGAVLPQALLNLGLSDPADDDRNQGTCPGTNKNLSCTAYCVGGTNNGARCDDVAGNSDCGGGGDCTATSAADPTNDCNVTATCNLGTNQCEVAGVEIGAACAATVDCYTCQFDNTAIDEYVRNNGPIRNMDLFAFNGPDMRFSTLEDIYGVDTGDTFQAAVGFVSFEKQDPMDPDPAQTYGVGVDDMFMEWREFTLIADETDCAPGGAGIGGSCATVDLLTTNFFEGSALLTIDIIDLSPSPNDCNDDGDNTDMGIDDNDCNNDGVADLRVEATSQSEVNPGEFVNVPCLVPTGSTCDGGEYRGQLALSSVYNVPGTLFVQSQGGAAAFVTVTYFDRDDGNGEVCKNDVDPAAQGEVQAGTAVLIPQANVIISGFFLSDNGDDDGWADTNETVDMQVSVSNKTGVALQDLTLRLGSNSDKIECITNPFIAIDFLPADDLATPTVDEGTVIPMTPFTFKVADVNRVGTVTDDFSAEFLVTIAGNGFDTTPRPQRIVLDLDLNASGGTGPGSFVEDFEGGLGSFSINNIDSGRNNPTNSQGYRCSYHDPDWPNSNSYGNIADCWLAATSAQAAATFWATTTDKAFSGSTSLYYGIDLGASLGFTTPMAILEAVEMTNPVNIGWDDVCSDTRTIPCTVDGDCPASETCGPAAPEASFKHQASFMNYRGVNARNLRSADAGVVQLSLADAGGARVGDWIKLEPFVNLYDIQREDNYTNCFFDPVDDGSTEDDFFDPSDPDRRLGPSSTCFPEFVFSWVGDSDTPFDVFNIGLASDGPGLCGDPSCGGVGSGLGTWVESKFNLARFRGRRVRLRMVTTALKGGSAESWEAIFQNNPDPNDDGWWVDQVQISDTLATPATLSVDNDTPPTQGCGVICTPAMTNAVLTADPVGGLSAPGQVVEVSAFDSTIDRCLDGTLQYKFTKNGQLFRDWTDNAIILDAPVATATYGVEIRCSSDPACADSTTLGVTVNCPIGPNSPGSFPEITSATTSATPTFTWAGARDFDWAEGDLATLRASGSYAGTTGTGSGASHMIGASANSRWVLLKNQFTGLELCNETPTWGSTTRDGSGELPLP